MNINKYNIPLQYAFKWTVKNKQTNKKHMNEQFNQTFY